MPAWVVAAGMAMLAGATDVYGLALLKDLFVSFMSGNTTMLAVALAHGAWGRAGTIGLIVALFVAGAACGAVLDVLGGKRQAPLVGLAVAAVLAVGAAWPAAEPWAFTLGMGMLNAAVTRVGGASVSLTYVTGTLVKLGQGLGAALCGRPGGWSFLWQAPMWASLLAGAVGGEAMRRALGGAAWPLPCAALLLAAAAWPSGRG